MTESAAVFNALPRFPADHFIPPDTWRTISARDEAMANNALAVLAHAEGKSILLFAHTSHLLNAPMLGGRWSAKASLHKAWGRLFTVPWEAAIWQSRKSNL